MIHRPVSEEWLGKRSEAQWSYSNAYVGIEQRAEAIRRLSPSENEREGDANAQRWAHEDATAIKWVRGWEVPLALAAIVRSKNLNRSYAAEIHQHKSVIEAVLQEVQEGGSNGRDFAQATDRAGPYVGTILSVDETTVTQRVGHDGTQVRHAIADLSRPVEVGETAEIVYRDGKAVVADKEVSQERGVGR